jgi:hypothetical protein
MRQVIVRFTQDTFLLFGLSSAVAMVNRKSAFAAALCGTVERHSSTTQKKVGTFKNLGLCSLLSSTNDPGPVPILSLYIVLLLLWVLESLSHRMAVSRDPALKAGETTPLLANGDRTSTPIKHGKSTLYLLLLTAFLVSSSFGVTQVP